MKKIEKICWKPETKDGLVTKCAAGFVHKETKSSLTLVSTIRDERIIDKFLLRKSDIVSRTNLK